MIRTESKHCQFVSETLNGNRPADKQSFDSIETLNDRLQKLQKINKKFAKVQLSDHAKQLLAQSALAVC